VVGGDRFVSEPEPAPIPPRPVAGELAAPCPAAFDVVALARPGCARAARTVNRPVAAMAPATSTRVVVAILVNPASRARSEACIEERLGDADIARASTRRVRERREFCKNQARIAPAT
jgi:hypothetical protein